MADEPNPIMARRRLAVRMARWRRRSERSLDELAARLDVSKAQASRLDTGARGYQPEQVDRLAKWYSLDPAEADQLRRLAAESRKRAWYQQVDLHDSYRTFIGLEQGASSVDEFCSGVIPGLLQTEAYARAAAIGSSFDVPPDVIEQAVEIRLRRQQGVYGRPQPPLLWFVMDEAVLVRWSGSHRVMRAQLDLLLERAATPRVSIQVVGFEQGIYLGSLYTQFIRLGMDGEIPDVLFSDGQFYPEDTTDPAIVARYDRVWDLLRALALDHETSRRRIEQHRSSL